MKLINFPFRFFLLCGFFLFPVSGFAKQVYINDSVQIRQYLDSARAYPKNIKKAMPYLDSAISLSRELNNEVPLASALIEKGEILQNSNLLKQADSNFRVARKILLKYPKDKRYLLLIKSLAICNYYLGNNQKVFKYTLEGLNIAKQLDNKLLQGTFYNISGIVMDEMGNKARALKLYLNALELFSKLKNDKKIASVEINIGVIYEGQANEVEAGKYYLKALKTSQKIVDTTIMAAAYNNLGNISIDRKEYKKALGFIRKSLEMSRQINDQHAIALDLSSIGNIYRKINDTAKEFAYYKQALKLAGKIQDKGAITISLINLTEYFESQNDISQAVKFAEKGLKYAKSGGNVNDVLAALKLLHKLYASRGNYKKAYRLLRSYYAINDSIFSKEKATQLMVVETEGRVKENNRKLMLAKETRKRVDAYLIISILSALLVIGILIFWVRQRGAKSKELKRQKVFMDALLEESESHVLLIDENARNTYLSPSYLKEFGRSLQARLGASVFEFVHPDDIPELKEVMAIMKSGETLRHNLLFRLQNHRGEYRTVRGVAKKIDDDSLSLKGYIVNFWDVTEAQKSQQALKENEEKLRDIFNTFPDIYFKFDNEGIITEISPSVEKIAGFKPEGVIGKPVSSFIQFMVDWGHARKIFVKWGKIEDLNVILFRKERTKIYCSLNAHVIKDQNDVIVGFEGTLRDITKRVQAEKELKKSQRKLKNANDSKDKLLAIIGHDLRGAIGTQKAILGLVTEDMDGFSKEEVISLVRTIKSSVDITYSMVENLLSWARIMRDNIMPRLVKNDLYPVIKDAFDVLQEQAKAKDIRLVYRGKQSVIAIFDPNLMDIVIRNLLTNAIKFSNPDNDVRINVADRPEGLEMSIEDWGVGMAPEEIHSVFSESEKMQSKPGTNREKGTGLGLIVVREFIAMNHGKLHIESELGKGTRFVITLPGITEV